MSVFTNDDYRAIIGHIMRAKQQDIWEDESQIIVDGYTIKQFQGSAFSSDYMCFSVIKEGCSDTIVVKQTNETENMILMILNRLENVTGIRVPTNFASAKLRSSGEKNLMVFESFVPGKELYNSSSEKWVATGSQLGKLQAALWSGIGNEYLLKWKLLIKEQKIPDQRDIYWGKLRNATRNMSTNSVFAETVKKATTILDHIPNVFSHGDLFPTNVIVAEDSVCFLDWANAAFLPYTMDIARMICLPNTEGVDMCSNQDEVSKAYYTAVKPILGKSFDDFLRDLYAAEIIELGNIYFPPIGWNAMSVQYKNTFNRNIEKKLMILSAKI